MEMKCFRLALVLLVLLLPLKLFAAEQGFARLSLIEGDVQVRIADSDDWVPAAANTPLYEGDSVWAPAGSRTEIQLRDGSVIRLDGKTSLNVLKVEKDFLQLNLGMGRAYLRTGVSRQWSIQVDLAESTVSIDDRGRYRLDIHANGDEEISVIRGSAYVESYGSRTRVRTGEMLTVEDSRSEISPIDPQDAWDRWNSDRDSHQARRSGGEGRLPQELVVYEEELSSSGEWIVTRDYGQVWRPTVVAVPDWAPYREGRWIWRGGEYVWVSYEPWGWAPYHYGRWTILPGFGWCWVPPLPGDVFWAPGYVGWISTPTYVGWVPLAPGEVYYGRGYYGRHSVNVTNVTNITVINNVNVYKNGRHRHALTAVDREGFTSGRGRYSRRSLDFFKKEKVVAGRPEPKRGAKEVLMPRVRKVSGDKLPPPPVARQPVGELKRKFPKLEHDAGRQPKKESSPAPAGDGKHGKDEKLNARLPGGKGRAGREAEGPPPIAGPADTPEARRPRPAGDERRERIPAEKGRSTPSTERQKAPGDDGPGSVPPRSGDRPERVKKRGGDPDESQTRRDGGRKEDAPPARKPKGVWKIKQKEEPGREKEKK
jgi:hypothetical protein